jgi:DNA-3-methyladenine glycosylase
MAATPNSARDKLAHDFFQQSALDLAQALIGKILVRRFRGKEYRAHIVETEAYLGPHDLACHSSKGRTRRTEVMFGPAGRAYVYFIYGMYEMLNIVAGQTGSGQAVLIRGAVPMDGWKADLSGPGKLARAFRVKLSENGMDLTGEKLFLIDDPAYLPRIVRTVRIGVDYAREWKDELLRFVDEQSVPPQRRRRLVPSPRYSGERAG